MDGERSLRARPPPMAAPTIYNYFGRKEPLGPFHGRSAGMGAIPARVLFTEKISPPPPAFRAGRVRPREPEPAWGRRAAGLARAGPGPSLWFQEPHEG